MAIRVTLDITKEQSFAVSENEKRRVRVHRVTGLTPATGDPLVQACEAVDSITSSKKVPRKGDPHPTIPNLRVTEVSAKHPANRADIAIVTTTYSDKIASGDSGSSNPQPRLLSIIVNGIVVQELSDKDYKGRVMFVGYSARKNPIGATAVNPSPGEETTPAGEVAADQFDEQYSQQQFPLGKMLETLEFEYEVVGNGRALRREYMDCVNEKVWQGDKPGTWLCETISETAIFSPTVENLKGPVRWKRRYAFRFDPDGWLRLGVYKRNGQIPSDVAPPNPLDLRNWEEDSRPFKGHKKLDAVLKGGKGGGDASGQGWGVFSLHDKADFNKLGLPDISKL